MDETVKTESYKLKELIINAIPVEQIYLFGSYAYGKPHKDSDLDLYVVLKDDVQMRDLDAGLQIRFAMTGDSLLIGIYLSSKMMTMSSNSMTKTSKMMTRYFAAQALLPTVSNTKRIVAVA